MAPQVNPQKNWGILTQLWRGGGNGDDGNNNNNNGGGGGGGGNDDDLNGDEQWPHEPSPGDLLTIAFIQNHTRKKAQDNMRKQFGKNKILDKACAKPFQKPHKIRKS